MIIAVKSSALRMCDKSQDQGHSVITTILHCQMALLCSTLESDRMLKLIMTFKMISQ